MREDFKNVCQPGAAAITIRTHAKTEAEDIAQRFALRTNLVHDMRWEGFDVTWCLRACGRHLGRALLEVLLELG